MTREKLVIFLWIYVLPLPACAALFLYWDGASRETLFALFCLVLPVVYGYVVPGIATNVMKKWRFRGPGRMGNYYWHHGFKYAAHLNISLFVAFGDMPAEPTGLRYLAACLCTGFVQGFIVWIHDTHLIRCGILEIDLPPSRSRLSAEQITFGYAPLTFFLIGLAYAVSVMLAYDALVVAQTANWADFFKLLFIGFLLMTSIPSLAYGYLERRRAGAGS